MSGISSSELENLVTRFHERTLPRDEWTHRAHLGVALWTLRRFEFEEALERMRCEISAYNKSIGLQNGPFSGYHETMTHFFARAVASFLREQEVTIEEDELWMRLSEKWGDKDAIFAYYSRRHLFSPSSRARFVPPDLQALDLYVLPSIKSLFRPRVVET